MKIHCCLGSPYRCSSENPCASLELFSLEGWVLSPCHQLQNESEILSLVKCKLLWKKISGPYPGPTSRNVISSSAGTLGLMTPFPIWQLINQKSPANLVQGGGLSPHHGHMPVQAQDARNQVFLPSPDEGLEAALVRTSKVTGSGVQWPGSGMQGVRKKPAQWQREKEVGTCRTKAGPVRRSARASTMRGHWGGILADWNWGQGGPGGHGRAGEGRARLKNNRKVVGRPWGLPGFVFVSIQ